MAWCGKFAGGYVSGGNIIGKIPLSSHHFFYPMIPWMDSMALLFLPPWWQLKTVDTIGNCQRPVFSLGVSKHMHTRTNLWKFELKWSSKLRDMNEVKKHPCRTKLFAFIWLISRPQILNLRSWNQIRWKLLLSRKLRHFRGSRFSQCFILSNLYQERFYANNYFE